MNLMGSDNYFQIVEIGEIIVTFVFGVIFTSNHCHPFYVNLCLFKMLQLFPLFELIEILKNID